MLGVQTNEKTPRQSLVLPTEPAPRRLCVPKVGVETSRRGLFSRVGEPGGKEPRGFV